MRIVDLRGVYICILSKSFSSSYWRQRKIR